ncbi:MAG: BamA/TamA family outer membrane protein [Acidobacteria bacterium]|nr:BamA/TamA family outer membrane protein [Acidobacteriota bacterium]
MKTTPQIQATACAITGAFCAFTFTIATYAQSNVSQPLKQVSTQLTTASTLSSTPERSTLAPLNSAAPTPTPISEPASQTPNQLADRVKTYDRNAPRRENLLGIKLVKHVNGLFGGFEQGAGFGGFGVEFTTADSLPGLELRARALTSTRLYRKGEVGFYVPKLGSANSHAEVYFTYLRRTKDNFFGIGPRTTDAFETNFDLEQRSVTGAYFYDFSKHFQLGGYVRQANTATYRGVDKKDKPVDQLFTGNPATPEPLRFAPGLRTNLDIFSYGVYAEANFRNNEKGLTKGFYVYERLGGNRGTGDRATGYRWTEFESDLRGYLPLGSPWTSLAVRNYVELKNPTGSNNLIPFYDESALGGRSYVRGFHTFRFRANNLLLFSTELRQTVWKQKDRRGLDLVGFGDGGQVWGDKRPRLPAQFSGNDRFDSRNWRFGTGIGVQYRYNRDFAVRLDFAHTNEANKIYFTLGRGF